MKMFKEFVCGIRGTFYIPLCQQFFNDVILESYGLCRSFDALLHAVLITSLVARFSLFGELTA